MTTQQDERAEVARVLKDEAQYASHPRAKDAMMKAAALLQADAAPIDMVLYCPKCHTQHIDAPEPGKLISGGPSAGRVRQGWTNPPHKSHLCHGCGHIWRPSDTPTNGVIATASGKDADCAPVMAADAEVGGEAVASIRTWHKNGVQHAELWNWDRGIEQLPDGDHELFTRPQQAAPVHLTPEQVDAMDDTAEYAASKKTP